MRIFITFGDEKFAKSRDFAAKMAKYFGGFDKVVAYAPKDIDDDFKEKHKKIFNIKRGYGLWLWKPYFIYKTLNEVCKDGDMLFYGDGGSFFFRSVKHIEKAMGDDDIWVSCVPFFEWQYTKSDAFKLLGCENEDYKKTAQIQGGFLYIRKTEHSVLFIKKWLEACCDIKLLHPDNIGLGLPVVNGFCAHREDQSLLSLLSKKEGLVPHKDPSQFGRYPEWYFIHRKQSCDKSILEIQDVFNKREYPALIILHRMPVVDIYAIAKNFLILFVPKIIGNIYIRYMANKQKC